mgnify:CR=1 FL=1
MTLDELRDRIDTLDGEILERLNERARCAQGIGQLKQNSDAPFYVPEREKAVFDKLAARNAGPLSNEAVHAIYREIISAVRALEKPISVAFLGPRDTFSHMAAMRVFGASADYHPLPSFTDIFTEVERARIDYGVVPVESSTGGAVSDALDLFILSNLKIVNEVMIHIRQNLLANCPIEEIERVYSKDNALLQCRNWLRANLPHAQLLEAPSTSEAASLATKENGAAAIASRLAAQTYNLNMVAEGIEDLPHNFTRFFVVGRQMVKKTGDDKTSVIIAARDKPGALHRLLVPFAEHGINLTRIESRPSQQRAWEYVFFIDMLGHVDDAPIKAALNDIGDEAKTLKVLGSFPRADVEE